LTYHELQSRDNSCILRTGTPKTLLLRAGQFSITWQQLCRSVLPRSSIDTLNLTEISRFHIRHTAPATARGMGSAVTNSLNSEKQSVRPRGHREHKYREVLFTHLAQTIFDPVFSGVAMSLTALSYLCNLLVLSTAQHAAATPLPNIPRNLVLRDLGNISLPNFVSNLQDISAVLTLLAADSKWRRRVRS
jgi:hypothetical protein